MTSEASTPERGTFLEQIAPSVRYQTTAAVSWAAAFWLAMAGVVVSVFWNLGILPTRGPSPMFWASTALVVVLVVINMTATYRGSRLPRPSMDPHDLNALANQALFIAATDRSKWEAYTRTGRLSAKTWFLATIILGILFLSINLRGGDWTTAPLFEPLVYVSVAAWMVFLGMAIARLQTGRRLNRFKQDLDVILAKVN